MLIDFGQGEKEVVISCWTAVLYEQEFKSDMLQDVLGKSVIRQSDFDAKDGDVIVELDFTRTQWTALLRVLWAGLKTVDDSIPSFASWAKTCGEVDMMALTRTLSPAISEQFFRAGAAGSE